MHFAIFQNIGFFFSPLKEYYKYLNKWSFEDAVGYSYMNGSLNEQIQ